MGFGCALNRHLTSPYACLLPLKSAQKTAKTQSNYTNNKSPFLGNNFKHNLNFKHWLIPIPQREWYFCSILKHNSFAWISKTLLKCFTHQSNQMWYKSGVEKTIVIVNCQKWETYWLLIDWVKSVINGSWRETFTIE